MDWLAILRVIGLSSIPFLELRVGIPTGIALGMSPVEATLWGIVGNLLEIPSALMIVWGARRLAERWTLAERFTARLNRYADRHQETVHRYGWLGITLVVGIPLPGTGLWTGAAIASLLKFPLPLTLLSLSTGIILAGILVGLLAAGAFEIFAWAR